MYIFQIENPELGRKEIGPFTYKDLLEIEETIADIKKLPKIYFTTTTVIEFIGNCHCLYDYEISQCRPIGHYIIKAFENVQDQIELDKWGDIYGYILWKGQVAPYKVLKMFAPYDVGLRNRHKRV